MEWRGGQIKPDDYGSQGVRTQLIGGGSTLLTKYYRTDEGRTGDGEVKEGVGNLSIGRGDIKSMTDPVDSVHVILNTAEKGNTYYTRSTETIAPLRVQVKLHANWLGNTATSPPAANPPTRMTNDVLWCAVFKRQRVPVGGTVPMPGPGSADFRIFDRTWNSELPLARYGFRDEIVAHGILEPDISSLNYATKTTESPGTYPVLTYIRQDNWNAHYTELDFDIAMDGVLEYEKGSSYPITDRLYVACWFAREGTMQVDTVDMKIIFTWDENPEARMWEHHRYGPDKNLGFQMNPDRNVLRKVRIN